jgi:glucokinase
LQVKMILHKTHSTSIGVDVGGTKIAAGLVDAQGHIHDRVQRPTPAGSPENILRGIADVVEEVIAASSLERGAIEAVGLGIPGPVDPERGIGIVSVNLGWRDVPVRSELEKMLGKPCFIENDVKAAALGEYRYGRGQGLSDMVYLSIGTGIEAPMILDGRLYRGPTGMAGEVGHAIVDREGPRCKCGATGCLEALASGPAIAARAETKIKSGRTSVLMRTPAAGQGQITAEKVFEAAANGDRVAMETVEETGDYLAFAVQLLIMMLDPQLVVIGGGVAQAGDVLLGQIRRSLARQAEESYVFKDVFRPERVQLTRLGSDAGILGAVSLVAPRL